MKKERKKGSGGKRAGFVKPKRYGEKTTTVSFSTRIPISKHEEFTAFGQLIIKPLIKEKLKTWEVAPDKENQYEK